MFITFEGCEGSGKTTQQRLLAERLRNEGYAVITTKEPGGTPLANRIRAILLDPASEGMNPYTELMLYGASRREHVTEVLEPAQAAGNVILCDRYTDSTVAYQGYGRALDRETIHAINKIATQGLAPDLTIIYDGPIDMLLSRARARNGSDLSESRFDNAEFMFHQRVREGYLEIGNSDSRYKFLDATMSIDELHEETYRLVRDTIASAQYAQRRSTCR